MKEGNAIKPMYMLVYIYIYILARYMYLVSIYTYTMYILRLCMYRSSLMYISKSPTYAGGTGAVSDVCMLYIYVYSVKVFK